MHYLSMKEKELNALLKLLTDPDDYISEVARKEIITNFDSIQSQFKNALQSSSDTEFIDIANEIYFEYNFLKVKNDFKNWLADADKDFFKGIFILNKLFTPNLEFNNVVNFITNIKRKFYHDVKNLSPIEQIRFLNFIIFKDLKINVVYSNEVLNSNLFSTLIDEKKASPTLITLLYFLLARRLDIPLYLIFSKNIILLAYFMNENSTKSQKLFSHKKINYSFFVNVPDRGYIYTSEDIKFVLRKFNIKSTNEFYILTPTNLLKNLVNKFIVLSQNEKNISSDYLLQIKELFD